MEAKDLEKYGNLPEHVRQSLLATDDAQPSQTIESEVSAQSEQPQEPEYSQSEPQIEPSTITLPTDEIENNEVKSWKGRLNKEQEAHRDTNARLLAEAQARQQAEAKFKAEEEKRTALEKQLAELQKPTQPQPIDQPPREDEFSEEELNEIENIFGATGKKLLQKLRQKQTQQSVPDVEKVVDDRLAQAQQQAQLTARQQAWYREVQTHIPEMQGLLSDSAFIQYAQDKQVDFRGNTAMDLINEAGSSLNVALVPQLRQLIDEFNTSKAPPKQTVTAPPTNQNPVASKQPSSGKKKITPEIQQQIRFLMNTGQVDKLKELQEQYEFD